MNLQQTIQKRISLEGTEPYGGRLVEVDIEPSEIDSGILFQTPKGRVPARLEYAQPSKSSIMLEKDGVRVLTVEHILATLYAYGIDNALVNINRKGRFLGTSIEVVPTFKGREEELCEKLEDSGTIQQSKERRRYVLKRDVSANGLEFHITQEGLSVRAITQYPIPGIEEHTLEITPKNYREQVAGARPFVKHIPRTFGAIGKRIGLTCAAVLYPSFGIGHGFSDSSFFFPEDSLVDWRKKEKYTAEIARHTIVDRLGAIALLGKRLEGVHVTAKFSGHKNDLKVLKDLVKSGDTIPA